MHVQSFWRLRVLAAVALSTVGLGGVSAASAAARPARTPKPATLIVNGSILSGYGHDRCSAAGFTTITAAVTAASPGSRIIVCPGTYHEDVTVTTPVSIE